MYPIIMMSQTMRTIKKTGIHKLMDRHSKFVAHAVHAIHAKDVSSQIDKFKKKYPKATHYCHAWRINPLQPEDFSQDDGEPSGTAGLPILGVLKSYDLVNSAIIVIRYYGGVKLGKPGLIHAYREASRLAVEKAELVTLKRVIPFNLQYPYDQESKLCEWIYRFSLFSGRHSYDQQINAILFCPYDKADSFDAALKHHAHLGICYERMPEEYI